MKTQLSIYQNRIQQTLDHYFKQHSADIPAPLLSAIRYSSLNQGKRLRPALVYAVGEALNIPLEKLDEAAMAIELIHCYSLVHDDLPAMDDDDLRRGQPTCHIQFDEATAILTGDAQLTLAFEILSHTSQIEPLHRIQMIQKLSQAAGPSGMIAGQMIDILSEGQFTTPQQLEQMHLKKTGSLIQCALHLGAIQAKSYSQCQLPLDTLGKHIGLAFQIQDDILDIESDTETLGKPQGSDLAANKSTYPSFIGLEASKQQLALLIKESQAQLKALELDTPFLVELINYIAIRKY